jgi:hypothetical protein
VISRKNRVFRIRQIASEVFENLLFIRVNAFTPGEVFIVV